MKRKSVLMLFLLVICLMGLTVLSGCDESSNSQASKHVKGVSINCSIEKYNYQNNKSYLELEVFVKNNNEDEIVRNFSYTLEFFDKDGKKIYSKALEYNKEIYVGNEAKFSLDFFGDNAIYGEVATANIIPKSINVISTFDAKENYQQSFGRCVADFFIVALILALPIFLISKGLLDYFDYDEGITLMIIGGVLYAVFTFAINAISPSIYPIFSSVWADITLFIFPIILIFIGLGSIDYEGIFILCFTGILLVILGLILGNVVGGIAIFGGIVTFIIGVSN